MEGEKVNLAHLLSLIDKTGGWHLTGKFHQEVNFDERVQRIQNEYGVNVFFTWGVIEQEGQNKLAIIAGGWNDALVAEEGDREEYLKLMQMYTLILKQAE